MILYLNHLPATYGRACFLHFRQFLHQRLAKANFRIISVRHEHCNKTKVNDEEKKKRKKKKINKSFGKASKLPQSA